MDRCRHETGRQALTNGRLRVLTVLAGLWCVGRALAADATLESPFPQTERASDQVKVELITEHASIQPHGKTRVGAHFTIADGWHIYAKETGDAGLPTTVRWASPERHWVSFGPLQYPKPKRFIDPGNITTFGYSGTVILRSTLTYDYPTLMRKNPYPTQYNEIPIRAEVKWLACREICVPGSATLELTLPVNQAPPTFSAHAQLFEHTP